MYKSIEHEIKLKLGLITETKLETTEEKVEDKSKGKKNAK
jgi:hypothetical protein